MSERNRPRINLTLDAEVKDRIQSIAEDLDVTVSRLVEEVLREFINTVDDDPMVGRRLSKQIQDRKYRSQDGDSDSQTIQNILDRMDELS